MKLVQLHLTSKKNARTRNLPDLGQNRQQLIAVRKLMDASADGKHVDYGKYVYVGDLFYLYYFET